MKPSSHKFCTTVLAKQDYLFLVRLAKANQITLSVCLKELVRNLRLVDKVNPITTKMLAQVKPSTSYRIELGRPELPSQIRKLRKMGWSFTKIGVKVGCKEWTANRIYKRTER